MSHVHCTMYNVHCTINDLFNAVLRMRGYSPSNVVPKVNARVHVIEPYRSTDSIADLKMFLLRITDILDFQMMFMLFSVDQAKAQLG